MHMRFALILVLSSWLASTSSAGECPSLGHCRETSAFGGRLLHDPNKNGQRVWTSPTECGSSTMKPALDPICEDIGQCTQAGGFGKFLRAVTFDCRGKRFSGYFGLDGLTFGILDWTAANVPEMLRAYRLQDAALYDSTFGKLQIPTNNNCPSAEWVCNANQQAKFMCDPAVRLAMEGSVKAASFQKAQAVVALATYEGRLRRYAQLGLKTEYGNTAMAVVGNNLLKSSACKPTRWKATCAAKKEEKELVDCMLDEYVKHTCRGSERGSKERRDAIKAIFAGASPSTNLHPTSEQVLACSSRWGV